LDELFLLFFKRIIIFGYFFPTFKISCRKRIVKQEDILNIRRILEHRREEHQRALWQEVERLTAAASKLGVRRIVLFGSLIRGKPGLATDLDLLIVWDTSLGFLDRTVELYRLLKPRVSTDMLVYTPNEMERMMHTPFVRKVLEEGKVLYEA
jgi:predicted nucleotidyltransferase